MKNLRMAGTVSSPHLLASITNPLVQSVRAPTVVTMFVALLGIIIGLAVAAGPLALYRSDVSLLSERMITAADKLAQGFIQKLPYASENPKVVTVLSVALAVATPGAVALFLVVAARAATGVRRAASGALVVGAALSFFVLPGTSALVLVLFALTVSAFLISPTVFIAKVVLWGFATIIAVDHIHSLWQGTAPTIQNGTQTLVELTGFSTAEFWKFALIIVGVSPFPIAASVGLKS